MQDVLPVWCRYLVDSCSDSAIVVHADIRTEDEAEKWLESYEELSLLTFRVARTFSDSGARNLLKVG